MVSKSALKTLFSCFYTPGTVSPDRTDGCVLYFYLRLQSAHDLQNTLTKLYQKPELDEFVSCKWISFRVETTTKTDAKSTKFMGELEKDEDSSMPPLTDEPMPALADFDNNSSNDDDEKQRS